MIDDSGAILDQFLTYVDLADCRSNLEAVGVYRFSQLNDVEKRALQAVLPDPAVNRILANVDKFATHYSKKEKYPPLEDFLEILQLTEIQKDLENQLKISRVEHLKYATVEDLQIVVSKDDAKRILKAYKKLKKSPLRKFEDWTKKVGSKVLGIMLGLINVSGTKNTSSIVVELPITSVTDGPSEPVETAKNTSPGTNAPTQQKAPIGQITSVHLSQIDFENYQQTYTPDDEVPSAPSPPNGSDLTDTTPTSSSEITSPDDWVSFLKDEIEEPKSSGRKSPISQDDWVIVEEINEYKGDSKKSSENEREPLNTSHVEESNIPNPECIEEECPDLWVLDYFKSARSDYSWQCFEDVIIKPSDISNVRCRLGDLRDLPDCDICDALRFVHSEHQYSLTFFDRPPPNCGMNTLTEWDHDYAFRALTLRHVYAIALNMTFDQCLEALSSTDWNFSVVLPKILL